MIRCKTCVMPNTRPDTPFIDGECSACVNYKKRPEIDWELRKKELVQLLDRHDGRCLVPSSGGKDSTYQVLTLLELGAEVTVVTARTCHLTGVGRANIDNLAKFARTIEVVPNMTVRAKLNRLGLELVGDISWPEHAAIFSTPFQVALQTNHSLIMYGECPQQEYGGPMGSEQAKQMTRRWRSEFGGFLGLRPTDFVGMDGITSAQMQDYEMPQIPEKLEAHFLGQYIPWDSRSNVTSAKNAGMIAVLPSEANYWVGENMDNAQTGLHDYFMRLKYGFGRGCQQISVDVRRGDLSREHALRWVEANDNIFPNFYMGISNNAILSCIGLNENDLKHIAESFKYAG